MELIVLALMGVSVYLLIKTHDLAEKIDQLSAELDSKELVDEEKLVSKTEAIGEKTEEMIKQTAENSANWLRDFWNWLKEDWLMKVGALLVLMAGAWFVRYAFLNDWIGPVGRVSLGIIAGTGILAYGYYLLKKKPIPAQVLVILGASMVLISLFAGTEYYQFYSANTALALMALVVAVLAVLAVVEKLLSFAVAFLVAGLIVPFFAGFDTYPGSPIHGLVLNGYVFLLSAATYAVVMMRGWRPLLLLNIVGVIFFTLLVETFDFLNEAESWLFYGGFFAMMVLGNCAAIFKTKKIQLGDLFAAGLVVFWTVGIGFEYFPRELLGSILAGATLLAILVSYGAYAMGAPKSIVYVQGAMSAALLGSALVAEFDEDLLAILLSLEVLGIMVLIRYLFKDKKALASSALLMVLPGFIALVQGFEYPINGDTLFPLEFFSLLVVSGVFAANAWMLNQLESRKAALAQLIAGNALFFFLIWDFALSFFDSRNTAKGLALTIFTLIGVALFYLGLKKDQAVTKIYGMVVMSLVALRLVFVEVWDMSLIGRVVTFVIIGVLFMLTAFINKSKN